MERASVLIRFEVEIDDDGEVVEGRARVVGGDGDRAWAELGDVLWYLAAFANEIDATLDDVADMNIRKLASRQERGVLGGSGDDR